MKRFLFAAACILLLTGCGEKEDPLTVNTLTLEAEGKLTAVSVADFDSEVLDLDEFKEQAAAEIGDYNERAGEERITLAACSGKEGHVTVEISYLSAQDYQNFNSILCATGMLDDLTGDEGLETNTYFYDESGTLRTTLGEIIASEGSETWKYLVVGEPLLVTVPGRILFTSGGATSEGRGSVQTGADMTDRILLDAPCYIIYEEI